MLHCSRSTAFLLATTVFCLAFISCTPTRANARQTVIVKTTQGDIAIETFERRAPEKRPAVIILSGSKGFRSAAYDDLAQSLDKAGLDAYLVHAVSDADLTAIGHAEGAASRINITQTTWPDGALLSGTFYCFSRDNLQRTGKSAFSEFRWARKSPSPQR